MHTSTAAGENDKKALRVREGAKILDISVSAMYDLVRAGRIGYVRLAGGSIRIPTSEVDRFLRENLVVRKQNALAPTRAKGAV